VLQPTSAGSDAVVFKLSTQTIAMTMHVSANPASSASPVTLSTRFSSGPVTQGVVTFYDGRDVLGSAVARDGVATLSATFAPGIHYLSATFGDGVADGDTRPLLLVVNPVSDCE
jgi:hypothetical protein